MADMGTSNTCLSCGAPLSDGAHQGFCPKCLFGQAIGGTMRVSPPDEEQIGTSIGRYKLLEKVGEGGFGAVYVAEQREPVKRRVALKIIKLGMDTRQVIARFEAERQALALMEHPNIAKVLDGGATETGRPYFVMELVRGMRITDYCDQNNLPTEQRLGLFMQVCHAIQHAHQKGIIHRDIKPSNILVTVLDGQPIPKVIDFGVAKATQGQLTDKTVYTELHQFIGTPAYMSPEQAALSAVDVDTRSDIYSLGVLLYELLTGHTPFDPKTLLAAGLDEMRRMIREQEPPRPSTRLGHLDETERTTVAKHRQAEPARLSRLVRGDLDWIVMKCLEKERGRRYETANALAGDIEHHLNHEPVAAVAPSALYRAGKFIRRHKASLATAIAVVLLLVAGVIMSTWQAARAMRAERVQTELRQRAESEKARADAKTREAETARELVEVRAYAGDMSLAAQSASVGQNLGTAQALLARWRHTQPDRRGWEWYYLNGLCHRELLTIDAETNTISSVAWGPVGRPLASAGRDGIVRLWDPDTGRKITELHGHTNMVNCVAWSPDRRWLASASSDRTIRVWDAATGRATLVLADHTADIMSVAWSHDATRLASTASDGTLRIWDATNGTQILTASIEALLKNVSWNSDDTRLAVAADFATGIWDAVTGRKLLALGAAQTVSWSPDTKWVATGDWGGAVKVLNSVSGTNVVLASSHGGQVMCVAWSPDGTRLASTSRGDGAVKVWDARSRTEVQTFRGHKGGAHSVTWRSDGKQVASSGEDGTIRIWEVDRADTDLLIKKVLPVAGLNRMVWSSDGRRLAVAGGGRGICVWDTATGADPAVLPTTVRAIRGLGWDPAGKRVAYGDLGGVIQLWDPAEDKVVWSSQAGASNGVQALAWSPDGTRLASVGGGNHLRIRDASTGTMQDTFDHRGRVGLALAWSPDGKQLAVGCGAVGRVLDATTGALLQTLHGHRDNIRSLAWSRDSRLLASASGDTTVKVWEAATGRQIHTLWGHSSLVWSVAWSPDQRRLASGSADGTVKIWDAQSGEEVCSLAQAATTESVTAVAWTLDGARLASCGAGGTVLVRDSRPGRAVEERLKLSEIEQVQGGKESSKRHR